MAPYHANEDNICSSINRINSYKHCSASCSVPCSLYSGNKMWSQEKERNNKIETPKIAWMCAVYRIFMVSNFIPRSRNEDANKPNLIQKSRKRCKSRGEAHERLTVVRKRRKAKVASRACLWQDRRYPSTERLSWPTCHHLRRTLSEIACQSGNLHDSRR